MRKWTPARRCVNFRCLSSWRVTSLEPFFRVLSTLERTWHWSVDARSVFEFTPHVLPRAYLRRTPLPSCSILPHVSPIQCKRPPFYNPARFFQLLALTRVQSPHPNGSCLDTIGIPLFTCQYIVYKEVGEECCHWLTAFLAGQLSRCCPKCLYIESAEAMPAWCSHLCIKH